MRIVKPTNPPSMAVIVDTIVYGEVQLSVSPAHADKGRIDVVYASNVVGILPGTPTNAQPLAPAVADGMRVLALLSVRAAHDAIRWYDIEEMP